MLDYNKESLNLSRTQCGPFINLQICSLLWLKVLSVLIESLIRFDQKFDQVRLKVFTNFGWKFDQAFINPDQVRLKVLIKSDWRSLIRFDWKFWSSLIESFINFGWKFWSSFYQFWLKVLIKLLSILIKSDWKFWSGLNESSQAVSFHQFWLGVWSNFYQSRSSPTESFDQVWLKVFDQVWLEVLIKFDWKFSSILVESFDQAFINSGWKFWSSFYQFWSSPIESFDQVWMKVLRQSVFINFGWEFDQTFINPDQVRLKVLIKSDWIRASPLHTWLVFIPLLEPLAF